MAGLCNINPCREIGFHGNLAKLMLTYDQKQWVCIVELDLELAKELYDYFMGYPRAATKKVVELVHMSTDQV